MATLYTTTVEIRGGGKTSEDAARALRSVLTDAERPVRQDGDAVLVEVDVNAPDTSEAELQALDRIEDALGGADMPAATVKAVSTRPGR